MPIISRRTFTSGLLAGAFAPNSLAPAHAALGQADDPATIAIIDKRGMIRVEIPGDDKSMDKNIQEKSLREAITKIMGAGQAAHRTPAQK